MIFVPVESRHASSVEMVVIDPQDLRAAQERTRAMSLSFPNQSRFYDATRRAAPGIRGPALAAPPTRRPAPQPACPGRDHPADEQRFSQHARLSLVLVSSAPIRHRGRFQRTASTSRARAS
jgi:hypothetical protein